MKVVDILNKDLRDSVIKALQEIEGISEEREIIGPSVSSPKTTISKKEYREALKKMVEALDAIVWFRTREVDGLLIRECRWCRDEEFDRDRRD